jgi:hypothetical protein
MSGLFIFAVTEAALQIFAASYKSENSSTLGCSIDCPRAVESAIEKRSAAGGSPTINSQGFRETSWSGPDLRIVVYGDSFVQGYFSEPAEYLRRAPGVPSVVSLGRDVEVVNAGVAGYRPDQELRKMG